MTTYPAARVTKQDTGASCDMSQPSSHLPLEPPVSDADGHAMPTGPVGRGARLILAAVAVESLVSIADQGGPSSFRGARNLTEPSLLLLDAIMVTLFVALVGVIAALVGRTDAATRWRVGALIALGATVGFAAVTSQLAHGTVWDRPLSDLVWWFDAIMLLETIAALGLAVVLGIPGCEVGVWPLLIARAKGEETTMRPIGCVVGLHVVDAWEASRRGTDG